LKEYDPAVQEPPMTQTGHSRPKRTPLNLTAIFCLALLAMVSRVPADPYEPDDTSATARRLLANDRLDIAEEHDFLTPDDEDWILFYVRGDYAYAAAATTVSATCDVTMTFFESDGVTMIEPYREWDLGGPGESEEIFRLNVPPGFYFARFRLAAPYTAGPGVTYWVHLSANIGAGLPIETVDEKTIGLSKIPESGDVHRTAGPVLTAGFRGVYTKHSIAFPADYVTVPVGTDIDVTMRQVVSETEKFNLPGQVFPWTSEALFVVETVQWSGTTSAPMAFTDPVTITVEFAPDPGPDRSMWNDVVTLEADTATTDRLKVVKDVIDGTGVDYQVIGGAVNAAERTVVVLDYANLTGPSGSVAYGVAAPTEQESATGRWQLYR
jgi:hypothetical protein